MKQIYAVALSAVRMKPDTIVQNAAASTFAEAMNEDEAVGMAWRLVRQHFPVSEGWGAYSVSVFHITEEMLAHAGYIRNRDTSKEA